MLLRGQYPACWAGRTFSVGAWIHTVIRTPATGLTHRRSGSFYPQPISNYKRKSTVGLAIDFPTLNVLGFICYSITTASFLYSPLIREQYAYRHPDAPENTVRFNDFLFAAHGAVLCVIIYSQFFPQIWGFQVGKTQRISKGVMGIWWGCIAVIVISTGMVLLKGAEYEQTGQGWAWIDVVSALYFEFLRKHLRDSG